MSTPIVKSASFVISNTDIKKCPQDGKPEYAFIGRSNVGKSSLINALTNQKKLAQTSATPGKTLLINHYLINNEWYLVDLPGYGYAKRSKSQNEQLEHIISSYVLDRDERNLSIRAFDARMKREAYEKQQGICIHCKQHFELEEMEADHITPWHLGGATIATNCQMLCRDCNRRKSGK